MVRNQANQTEKTNTCTDYNRVDEPKMIINIIEDTKNSETASIMFLVKNTFRGSITNNNQNANLFTTGKKRVLTD